ncbi:hypothetical protein [Actinoplanes sp. NPDC049599]|uniref:hypothetical protein n=1 Tax=Actinoplanes sp. NPDC049599 TaxID=3363903 RepID=UPI0037960966
MTLTLCPDVAAAGWIVRSDLPWHRLVGFGPAGFDAYARLRLLPDPERLGQSENDVQAEDWRMAQLPRLFTILAAHTTTADRCYVCVWDGWGPDARPAPKVVIPHREYWLFQGPLTGLGTAGSARAGLEDEQPAFVWPADHAWCFAHDVDPHWAGIGGPAQLIDRLITDPELDAVRADPAEQQPFYR